MIIPDHFQKLARDVADQVQSAGLTIKNHEYITYQGKLFHRLTISMPAFDESAHCHGLDTNIFYPEPTDDHRSKSVSEPIVDHGNTIASQAKYAARVCQGCPFLNACMEWAIANNEYGVWGGTTDAARKVLRKERRQMVMPNENVNVFGAAHFLADVA